MEPSTPAADGRIVATIPAAIEDACGFFRGRVDETLQRHDLAGANAGEWYALDACVTVYDSLQEQTGKHTVHRVGKDLADHLSWPADVETAPEALSTLDEAFASRHRGDAGQFAFKQTGDESGRLTVETPYPDPVVTGILRGIGQRFTDSGYLRVDPVADAGRTVFEVTWWTSTAIEPTVEAVTGQPSASAD